MSNEVKSDFPEMPKSFWHYAYNPITGFAVYTRGDRKTFKRIGKDDNKR